MTLVYLLSESPALLLCVFIKCFCAIFIKCYFLNYKVIHDIG